MNNGVAGVARLGEVIQNYTFGTGGVGSVESARDVVRELINRRAGGGLRLLLCVVLVITATVLLIVAAGLLVRRAMVLLVRLAFLLRLVLT